MAADMQLVYNDQYAVVTVMPPNDITCIPLNVVVVYDKSGSMSEAANMNGPEESKYFSKNDLAAHAVEIIANGLSSQDTLTVIVYDNYTHTLVPRMNMTSENKKYVVQRIKMVYPGGGTALWDGLLAGMKATEAIHGNSVVILITDGCPSSSPPGGEAEALRSYRVRTGNSCRLHTIGIGYNINSELLNNLASVGGAGGIFHFVPDGSMVITNFVNMLGNEKCVHGKELCIRITGKNVKVKSAEGYWYDQGNGYIYIHAGCLRYDQPRDIVVCLLPGSDINTWNWSADYVSVSGTRTLLKPTIAAANQSLLERAAAMTVMQRAMMIDTPTANKELCSVVSNASVSLPIHDDISGEVSAALKNMQKWGMHYLRNLMSAHINQVCTNFKDPGLQVYGGPMFKEVKRELNKLCDDLPAPYPSLKPRGVTTINTNFHDMFNNASGGCLSPDTMVLMRDGTYKIMKYIVAGDIVHGGYRVVCVVTYANVMTIRYNRLWITPWHPVRVNNEWCFPINLVKEPQYMQNNQVYNLVLDSGHVIVADGVEACTLGHNFTDNDVITHAFYGTDKVVQDLSKFPGFYNGQVDLGSRNQVIDDKTQQVCGYIVV